MKVFPLSLSGDARKWWMNEGDGKITTWEELVKKLFRKFYPISCASNYDKMCDDDDEGRDPLEFIPWMNSKFKDHRKEPYGDLAKTMISYILEKTNVELIRAF
ncbi:hypothetical protein Tco_0719820 [Tanacetum coccineum]